MVPTATDCNSIEMQAKTANDPSGGIQYYFEETSGNPGASNSGWQNSRSYTDGGLEPNTEYTYRVVTRDSLGNTGSWSVSKSAVTDDEGPENHPPYEPSNPTPVPSANNIAIGTTLSWSGGDQDGDSVTYDVYLSVAPEPDKLEPYQEDLTDSICVIPNLNIELKYYWRVVATDEHGAVTEGPVWTFFTKTLENSNSTDNNVPNKPSKPSLIYPSPMQFNVGDLCFFSTSVSDPDGDNLNVYWDFDEDDCVDYEVLNFSGTDCGVLYHWQKPAGQYNVRVITNDLYHETSEWSNSLFISVQPAEDNNLPNNASAPGGISKGYVKKDYTFNTYSVDPDDDKVKYRWDWGDGTFTDWGDMGWLDSGETASYSHSWDEKGTYYVRVKVKDLNGEVTPWSDTKKVTIVEKQSATIYNKDDFTGATYGDIFDNFLGEGRIVHANGNSGTIVTGSFGGCPMGHSWSTACQGVDFYLGREKEITIDAEIDFISGTEFVTPASFAWLYKVLRIDNFYDPDIEHKVWMNNIFDLGLRGLKDVAGTILKLVGPSITQTSSTTIDLWHVLKIAGTLSKYSYSENIASQIIQQTSVSRMMPNAANVYSQLWDKVSTTGGFMHTESSWTTTLKTTAQSKIPAAGIWLAMTAAIEIWTLFQLMTHWNVDTLLNEYEKNGQSNTEHVTKTVTLNEGNHDVWAGLQTEAFGMAICFGFGYGAGQVKSITIEGIAPPEKPVLSYPDTLFAGDQISFRPYCVDQNDDPVKYIIDWGDGTDTTTDFFDSGDEGLVKHKYSKTGTYTVTIKAEDCDRMQSEVNSYEIIVTGDNDDPEVSISSPGNFLYLNGRQTVRFGIPVVFGDITIEADAYDQGSGISHVEFYVDGTLVDADETVPYSTYYSKRGIGGKNIVVKAFDNSGKKTTASKRIFYCNLV